MCCCSSVAASWTCTWTWTTSARADGPAALPARRLRYSARLVKCSTSRYHVRDHERGHDRPCQSVAITRVQITIRVPPPDRPAARPRRANQPPGPRPPCPGSRRAQVTRIMASQPGRDWAGRDLADLLGIKPRNMLTQLAEWTRLGFLAKTGPGRYALPAPASRERAVASRPPFAYGDADIRKVPCGARLLRSGRRWPTRSSSTS